MSEFQPFEMERFMSKFEQEVDYNLSESGVHPMLLKELLADAPEYVDHLMDTDLNYPYVNGTPELRENIAALYKGATPENVLVTVGAIEANYNATRTLLSAGDEIVIFICGKKMVGGRIWTN
jgi:aspartate/methionine/tyrosine aminotransferase